MAVQDYDSQGGNAADGRERIYISIEKDGYLIACALMRTAPSTASEEACVGEINVVKSDDFSYPYVKPYPLYEKSLFNSGSGLMWFGHLRVKAGWRIYADYITDGDTTQVSLTAQVES